MSDMGTGVGSLLVGDMIATAIWGISSFQTYTYFYYPQPASDSNYMRWLVVILWVLDTTHIICVSHLIYFYLIVHFGDQEALKNITWSLALSIGITTVITWIVHCFFARRIYLLSRGKRLIPGIIVGLAFIRLAFGFGSTTECFKLGTFERYSHLVRWLFTGGLSVAVFSDGIITTACCYYLSQARTGFQKSDDVVTALQRYLIQSGAMTAIVTAVSLLCAAIMPFNMVWIGAHFVISKLYTASLVAALNSRESLQSTKSESEPRRLELNDLKIQVATTHEVMDGGTGSTRSEVKYPTSPRIRRGDAFYIHPYSGRNNGVYPGYPSQHDSSPAARSITPEDDIKETP